MRSMRDKRLRDVARELRIAPDAVRIALKQLGIQKRVSTKTLIDSAAVEAVREMMGSVRCPKCSARVRKEGGSELQQINGNDASFIACASCGYRFCYRVVVAAPKKKTYAWADPPTASRRPGVAVSPPLGSRKLPQPQQPTRPIAPLVPSQTQGIEIEVKRFPFEFLPAGEYTIERVIDYYRHIAENSGAAHWEREIQWVRLHKLNALKPKCCSVGRKGWLGYVVFEFAYSAWVVLECPIYGNATYLLSDDWRAIVGLSKGEIRRWHQGSYKKVCHLGDWVSRIREGLILRPPPVAEHIDR